MGSLFPHPVPGADKAVDSKTPPAFLFATCEDELVPINNSLSFAAALDKAEVPFELHVFQKGVHGLSLAKPLTSSGVRDFVNPAVAQWFRLSVDWLHGLWGDFAADAERTMDGVLTEYDSYGIDVALRDLWSNELCRALLLEKLPPLADEKAREMALPASLRMMSIYAKDMIPPELLSELDEALKKIPVE
jgi:hypothetical protein